MKTTVLQRIGLVLIILVAISVNAMAAEKTVTIDLTDVSVRDALSAVLDKADVSYVLKPGITGNIEKISFKAVRLQTALESIVQTSNLVYDIEDGIYVFSPKEQKVTAVVVSPQQKEAAAPESQTSSEPAAEQQVAQASNAPEVEENPYQPSEYENYPPYYDWYYNPYLYRWPTFEYGGVIYNPPPGPISPPRYPIGLPHPPLPPAPWRGTVYLNGVPVY